MAELRNELSWSRSRIATFRECLRRYWYQYYGKWGGWAFDAPAATRRIYVLSRMTRLPLAAGDAVHRVIRRGIGDAFENRPPAADPEREVTAILDAAWQAALRGAWQKDPKRWPPFQEIWYGPPPDAAVVERAAERARRSVRHFFASDTFEAIRQLGGGNLLALDESGFFDDPDPLKVGGRRVWALPDLAMRTPEGCTIWDWKTGETPSDDTEQVTAYALDARHRWPACTARIRAVVYYLAPDTKVETEITEAKLEAARESILLDIESMEGRLADVETNRADESAFPRTEDRSRCDSCSFREVCL